MHVLIYKTQYYLCCFSRTHPPYAHPPYAHPPYAHKRIYAYACHTHTQRDMGRRSFEEGSEVLTTLEHNVNIFSTTCASLDRC